MKRINQILFLAVVSSATGASAQSPREQLAQMVVQLQATPTDTALRGRLIALALEVKPAPAVPEDANRAFVRGNVFQKETKDSSGYNLAITAYRDALRIAPWWGDAYHNLAVALESAGRFTEAICSMKLYLSSMPAGSAEARAAQNQIYAMEAKSEMAARGNAIAAAAKENSIAQERPRPTVEGTWTISGAFDFQVVRDGERFAIVSEKRFGVLGGWRATGIVADAGHLRFAVQQTDCPQCGAAIYDLTLSSSGNELTGTFNGRMLDGVNGNPLTRVR
ncbi:MAG: hypothetical protein ACR2G6_07405 [Gemmatimonadaceae bacterium]